MKIGTIQAITVAAVVGASALSLQAQTRVEAPMPFLHPLFSDHAVLQRDADVPVWGWANPDSEVTVEFAGQTVKATAGKDGKWMATLAPMGYSTESRTMKVSGTANNLTQVVEAKDILVGDVWLCSGQSNMEMGIKNCNAQQDIDSANFPNLRLLAVPKSVQYKPQYTAKMYWAHCTPQSLSSMGDWGG